MLAPAPDSTVGPSAAGVGQRPRARPLRLLMVLESDFTPQGGGGAESQTGYTLLLDGPRRAGMRAHARRVAEAEFDVERQITRTLDVYAEARERRAAAAGRRP